MAGKSEKKQVILFGLRSSGSYGDDVTPTAAMLCSAISHTPLAGSTVTRDNYKGFMGASGQMRASAYQEVSFDIELAASGSPGVAPAYSELLRTCGFAETIVASTSVAYTPIDSAFEDGTLYYYVEDVLHKLIGARGSVEFDLSLGAIPKAKFKFIGLYVPASTATPAGLDFSGFKTPKIATSKTVKTFNFFGLTTLQMNTLTVNPGISVGHSDLTNQEVVEYLDRAGSISVKFREPNLATADFFEKSKDGVQGGLIYQLGNESTEAGYVVKVEVANLQANSTTRSFEQNKSMLTVAGDIVPLTANTDLTLTFL